MKATCLSFGQEFSAGAIQPLFAAAAAVPRVQRAKEAVPDGVAAEVRKRERSVLSDMTDRRLWMNHQSLNPVVQGVRKGGGEGGWVGFCEGPGGEGLRVRLLRQ